MPTTRAAARSASCRATPAGPEATSSTRPGSVGDDVVDHGPPPPPVLAHGQHLGQSVVALGQRREERLGEPVGVLGLRCSMAPPRVRRSHRRRWRRGESCEPEALRRARGGSRPRRQHRRPGPGPRRCPGGAVGQGPVPEGQGLRRLHRATGPPGPGRPRGARAARARRGRHGRGRPDRPAGAACPASTAHLSGPGPGRAPGRCWTTPSDRRPRRRGRSGRGPGRPSRSGRARSWTGSRWTAAPSVRADFVIGADGATSHVAESRRPGGRGPGALGLRRALLSRPDGGAAGHHPVGADPLAGLPRLRLDLPRARRRGQRRAWAWAPWPTARPARQAVRVLPAYLGHLVELGLLDRVPDGTVPAALGGLAQDGHGRDGARRRAGCSWWGTRPDWSTPSRARASPRP